MTAVDHSILKGEGVTEIVNDDKVNVGNIKLFKRLSLYDDLGDEQNEKAMKWNEQGGTIGFLGISKAGISIVGMFCVADRVRPEARIAVVTTLIYSFVLLATATATRVYIYIYVGKHKR